MVLSIGIPFLSQVIGLKAQEQPAFVNGLFNEILMVNSKEHIYLQDLIC